MLACRLSVYHLVADQGDNTELTSTFTVLGMSISWDIYFAMVLLITGCMCDISVIPRF
jgi:hypothetical protein